METKEKMKKAIRVAFFMGATLIILIEAYAVVACKASNNIDKTLHPYKGCKMISSTEYFTVDGVENYEVKGGETVSEIAEAYCVKNAIVLLEYSRKDIEYSIIKINDLNDNGYIKAGTILYLPKIKLVDSQ